MTVLQARLETRSRHWRWGFLAALAGSVVAFAINAGIAEIESGNAWGLSYGVAAAVLFVGAALFGLRRRTMASSTRLRLGSARSWLYFHVYGGLLFLVLVLMHSGFGLPTGALTWWLWGLSWWTVLSGLLGLLLQQWIPRVLGSALSIEVLYERIPELTAEIRSKADAIVEGCSEPVKRMYAARLAPALARPIRRLIFFTDVTGGIQSHLRELHYLETLVTPEERQRLEDLARLYETKLELDAHYSLQWPLRWWLYTHVPLTLLLLVLIAAHVFTVFYF